MLEQCWTSVSDAGPTLIQHWTNVTCLTCLSIVYKYCWQIMLTQRWLYAVSTFKKMAQHCANILYYIFIFSGSAWSTNEWRHRISFWLATRWKWSYIRPPPLCIIVLASLVKIGVKAIERIGWTCRIIMIINVRRTLYLRGIVLDLRPFLTESIFCSLLGNQLFSKFSLVNK